MACRCKYATTTTGEVSIGCGSREPLWVQRQSDILNEKTARRLATTASMLEGWLPQKLQNAYVRHAILLCASVAIAAGVAAPLVVTGGDHGSMVGKLCEGRGGHLGEVYM